MIKNNNEINYVLSGSTLEVNVKNENHLYSILSSEFNNLFEKYENITEIKFNGKYLEVITSFIFFIISKICWS